MKKFIKILVGVAAVAAIAFGAYYAYKNYLKDYFKGNKNEDEDDLAEDDFEMADIEEESREYVSINVPAEETAEEETASQTE